MMFVRIGNRAVNLGPAQTIDYIPEAERAEGTAYGDRLIVDFGGDAAAGDPLIIDGAAARAAWAAIAAAIPDRAAGASPPPVPADSPAGRVAWAEARLRDLAASAEAGAPPTGPTLRAAANQLRAALAEMAEAEAEAEGDPEPGPEPPDPAEYRIEAAGRSWVATSRAGLEAAADEIGRAARPGGYAIAGDGECWGHLSIEGPGVWRITRRNLPIARRPRRARENPRGTDPRGERNKQEPPL